MDRNGLKIQIISNSFFQFIMVKELERIYSANPMFLVLAKSYTGQLS